MQKKVMALAVAGVLAAPVAAFAQANYEIYGRANLGLDSYSATGAFAGSGADLKSRNRVYDSASRVGFRGAEDLGGGLKAFFQIESGVNMDTGTTTGQGGQGNTSAGTWGSRDSFVGLQGDFGRLALGRQGIFWVNGVINQFGANYVNTEVPWANGASMGTGAPVIARTNNVVTYTTPTVSGLNGTLYYSPQGEAQQAGLNTDGKITALTARYTSPFVAQFDYVNYKGNSVTAGQDDDKRWKLGLGYNYMPGGLVSFIYVNDKYTPAGASDRTANAWTVSIEHQIGSIQLLAQYGVHSKVKVGGTEQADTGAKAYEIGARYFLSKRTWTYLTMNKTTNEAAQNRDYTAAGMTSANPGISVGADPRIIALGILHNF